MTRPSAFRPMRPRRWWRRFPAPRAPRSHDDAREQMVRTQIEARGLNDPELLRAFRTVPRELFVAGRAGERFAVRNSGAVAVIEGAGDHCAEYMTGGTLVVLGPVGANVGAGMTGGEVWVHDPAAGLPARVNPELVEAVRVSPEEVEPVRALIGRHVTLTDSDRAKELLADWDEAAKHFWKVAPRDGVESLSRKQEGTLARGAGT